MVKFFQNLLLYWQFKRAFKKCDRLNKGRKNNFYIVANIAGHPYIFNRQSYRHLRHRKRILRNLTWKQLYDNRVTRTILD